MPERKVLCLLGMHRSGTSLVAQWLQQCGLNMGETLLKADFSNQKGHFEDLDFLALHKEVLQLNGLNTSGLKLDAAKKLQWSDYLTKKKKHIIALKNELNVQWGWKDPRTCLFLDAYISEIPDLTFLVVHRPAKDVIQSLLNRDWKRWKQTTRQNGIWGLHFKFLALPFFRRKLVRENLPQYLNACELYFSNLMTLLQSRSNKVKLITLQSFTQSDKEIFEFLTNNGFELNYFPAKNIFDSELMGSQTIDFSLSSSLIKLDTQLSALAEA